MVEIESKTSQVTETLKADQVFHPGLVEIELLQVGEASEGSYVRYVRAAEVERSQVGEAGEGLGISDADFHPPWKVSP